MMEVLAESMGDERLHDRVTDLTALFVSIRSLERPHSNFSDDPFAFSDDPYLTTASY